MNVDGTEAAHRVEGDQIVITPVEPLEPGATARVEVRYAGRPDPTTVFDLRATAGLQHDEDGGWYALSQPDGTRTWLPANDHPSDKATWRITLDTPDDAVGVANGRLRSEEQADGRTRWVWEVDQPMATYLAVVAIGDFELVRRTGPAGTKVISAFPRGFDPQSRMLYDGAIDGIVEELAATYGPYPDDDLGVVVVPDTIGVAPRDPDPPHLRRTGRRQ